MFPSPLRQATSARRAMRPAGSVLTDPKSIFFSLLLAGALISSPAAQAAGDVWSFDDNEGVTHFSNVPDNSRYRLILKDAGGTASTPPRGDGARRPTTPWPWAVGRGPLPFAEMVAAAASAQKLDPALLHAIIHVESRHNPAARSAKGAVGLMQVLPETARRMGVASVSTPAANIDAGARYLRFLLDIFDKDIPLALAAYNAGENAVLRYGRAIPPYPETLAYVPAVIAAYQQLRQR